jgi:hypothetical protein
VLGIFSISIDLGLRNLVAHSWLNVARGRAKTNFPHVEKSWKWMKRKGERFFYEARDSVWEVRKLAAEGAPAKLFWDALNPWKSA